MAGIEGEARCPRCGAELYWRLSENNRRLALDAKPDRTGNVIVIDLPDGRVRAKVLSGLEMPAQQEAFRQHACPKPERPGPRCAVCLLRMDHDLAYAERWTVHPCCEPGYAREVAAQAIARTKALAKTLRRAG